MNKEIFKQYADIKNEIKSLSEKAEEIEKQVSEEMMKEEVEEVKSDFGTFFFTARKTWTYPDYVKIAEDATKAAKKQAETNGDAKFIEKKSLTYRSKTN